MSKAIKRIIIGVLASSVIMLCGTEADVSAATKHNVTYVYGTKMVTVQVKHGQNAPVPTDTYVPGYQFTSWVGNAANVTEDRVILGAYTKDATVAAPVAASMVSDYTKKFNSNKSAKWPEWWATLNLPKGVPGKTCALHWFNEWTGELWKTDIIPYGSSMPTPPDPCLSGYDFAGWEGDWTNVTEDRAIGACYYITHKVKYIDSIDDDVIDVHYVRDGEGDWVDPPHHDGKKFVHYEQDDGSEFPGSIHYDMDVYAIYKDRD